MNNIMLFQNKRIPFSRFISVKQRNYLILALTHSDNEYFQIIE